MKNFMRFCVVILIVIGVIGNAYALDQKREERWTRWRINKLKWERDTRNLRKEENLIPLEERFARHWQRMNLVEKKHKEVASLLKGVIPAEHSDIKPDLRDEGYEGVKYPEEFIMGDSSFIQSSWKMDKIEKLSSDIRDSVLIRYRKQDKRLFAIEERFWRMARLLHEIVNDDNMEIMTLEDDMTVENVDNRRIKYDSASSIDVYLNWNLRRLDELERTLDVMKEWLLVIKEDHGEITRDTLKKDNTYRLWRDAKPVNFATVHNKWPVYGITMREVTVFDRMRPVFEQRRRHIKEVRDMLDKKFKEEKKEFSEEFEETSGSTKIKSIGWD